MKWRNGAGVFQWWAGSAKHISFESRALESIGVALHRAPALAPSANTVESRSAADVGSSRPECTPVQTDGIRQGLNNTDLGQTTTNVEEYSAYGLTPSAVSVEILQRPPKADALNKDTRNQASLGLATKSKSRLIREVFS